jgi:N-acylneuraminate cytidylyltransferase/CMP-N,N'-diacetyllegionaminic acid synthase
MKSAFACTICARKGSKGVKNKNVRLLEGKPLISHSIEQAIDAGFGETLIVSSDSDEILEIANSYQVPHIIRRPDELAHDTADKLEAIKHAITAVESKINCTFSNILDLDPTSPLRLVDDIFAAIDLFRNSNADNLITGMSSRRSPYFNLVETNSNGFVSLSKPPTERIFRRQDSPKCYDMNASIYIWKRKFLFDNTQVFGNKTVLYSMPENRSIDIDSELDFEFVSFLMHKKNSKLTTRSI